MNETEVAADVEFAAMKSVLEALEPLDANSRQRVFEYVGARLEICPVRDPRSSSLGTNERARLQPERGASSTPGRDFATLAELHDAASPQGHKARVLVTAYWLQIIEGEENFVSYSVNKALKDLGHGVSNITGELDALRQEKPALVLQLKKAGKTRQARKTYKITSAGIAAVEEMIDG